MTGAVVPASAVAVLARAPQDNLIAVAARSSLLLGAHVVPPIWTCTTNRRPSPNGLGVDRDRLQEAAMPCTDQLTFVVKRDPIDGAPKRSSAARRSSRGG